MVSLEQMREIKTYSWKPYVPAITANSWITSNSNIHLPHANAHQTQLYSKGSLSL